MKNEFLNELCELLEIDKIEMSDLLNDFENWDSFVHLSVIVYFDSEFDIILSNDDIKKVKKVSDLWDLISYKNG